MTWGDPPSTTARAAAFFKAINLNGVLLTAGTANPEGVRNEVKGTVYFRSDGKPYIKTTTGDATGWRPIELGPKIVTALELRTQGTGTDGASFAFTASVTPLPNYLCLIAVESTAATTPNEPTVTGCGLTWEVVSTQLGATSTRRLTVLRAMGGAPTSGIITIDFGGQTQTGISGSLCHVANLVQGANGANAIGATGATNGSSVTSLSVPLTPTGDGSAVYGAFTFSANEVPVAGTGMTKLGDAGHVGPNARIMSEWSDENSTPVAASWATASSAVAIAVELLAEP